MITILRLALLLACFANAALAQDAGESDPLEVARSEFRLGLNAGVRFLGEMVAQAEDELRRASAVDLPVGIRFVAGLRIDQFLKIIPRVKPFAEKLEHWEMSEGLTRIEQDLAGQSGYGVSDLSALSSRLLALAARPLKPDPPALGERISFLLLYKEILGILAASEQTRVRLTWNLDLIYFATAQGRMTPMMAALRSSLLIALRAFPDLSLSSGQTRVVLTSPELPFHVLDDLIGDLLDLAECQSRADGSLPAASMIYRGLIGG